LVSPVSGGQKRCSIQDLRGFAQILYRGHERFEPLALFVPQGSLLFPPLPLLGILQGCEVPEEATTYVLPHHSYSDGLVEAHDPKGEMFGFPRLRALVAEHGAEEERPLGEFLMEELYSFVGEGWEQEDDITLLTLERSPIRT
jgi:hypothetical protein